MEDATGEVAPLDDAAAADADADSQLKAVLEVRAAPGKERAAARRCVVARRAARLTTAAAIMQAIVPGIVGGLAEEVAADAPGTRHCDVAALRILAVGDKPAVLDQLCKKGLAPANLCSGFIGLLKAAGVDGCAARTPHIACRLR